MPSRLKSVNTAGCWFSPFLHNVRLTGAWDRDTAGGNYSERTWGKNPHYKLDVQHRGIFLFTVAATDRAFNEDDVELHLVGMHLLPATQAHGRVDYPLEWPRPWSEGKVGQAFLRVELEVGSYWIVPDAFNATHGSFVLQAASPTPFRLAFAPRPT